MNKDYILAGFRLRADEPCADLVDAGLRGFKPFAADYDDAARPVMELHADLPLAVGDYDFRLLHRFEFEDAKHDCFFCRYEGGHLFYMRPQGCDDASHDTVSQTITASISDSRTSIAL